MEENIETHNQNLFSQHQGCQHSQNFVSTGQDQHFIGEPDLKQEYSIYPYVLSGYRNKFNTPKKALKSVFMIHNQSVNIWSHLVPAVLFILFLFYFSAVIKQHQTKNENTKIELKTSQKLRIYAAFLERISRQGTQKIQKLEESNTVTSSKLKQYRQALWQLQVQSNSVRIFIKQSEKLINEQTENIINLKIKQFQSTKNKDIITIQALLFNKKNKLNILKNSQLKKIVLSVASLNQNFKQVFDEKFFPEDDVKAHEVSRLPILFFVCSAIICLLCSTIYHTFFTISSKAYSVFLRLDMAGISLVIAGICVPCFYYSMYCHQQMATIYITYISVMAMVCFLLILTDQFNKNSNIHYRALAFTSLGVSGLLPIIHILINQLFFDNFGDPFSFKPSAVYYILAFACFLMGLYSYSTRCPERHHPGKYDICGYSHQIFHIMVELGKFFCYFGLIQLFEMRKQSVCPV